MFWLARRLSSGEHHPLCVWPKVRASTLTHHNRSPSPSAFLCCRLRNVGRDNKPCVISPGCDPVLRQPTGNARNLRARRDLPRGRRGKQLVPVAPDPRDPPLSCVRLPQTPISRGGVGAMDESRLWRLRQRWGTLFASLPSQSLLPLHPHSTD